MSRLPTTWNRFYGLCKCAKISTTQMGKFYCDKNSPFQKVCNYSDPLYMK